MQTLVWEILMGTEGFWDEVEDLRSIGVLSCVCSGMRDNLRSNLVAWTALSEATPCLSCRLLQEIFCLTAREAQGLCPPPQEQEGGSTALSSSLISYYFSKFNFTPKALECAIRKYGGLAGVCAARGKRAHRRCREHSPLQRSKWPDHVLFLTVEK
eukprot:2589673-Rhodomonas_salina.2